MRQPAAVICLTDEEAKTLGEWTRRGKNEHRLVERARIIQLANAGRTNQQIAEALSTRTARVSKWRQRFRAKRLEGLSDAARSGKPAKYDRTTEKRVLALLDEPAPKGYSQWNGRLLSEALSGVSKDQVWRVPPGVEEQRRGRQPDAGGQDRKPPQHKEQQQRDGQETE